MIPIQTNKRMFFDSDGSPLEGGSIWIGQPSTDPRTNPKTVTFRDSGGSEFTAAQPLKTKAGRIVYNGRPITALVDGEYSMLVINANGNEAEPYAPSVNSEEAGGGGIADFSEVTRVGLTLNEIKAFDASVGDVIENSGKVVATDGLGRKWLVVSATGSPGDDISLIDLNNGLQGQKINNDIYTSEYEATVAEVIRNGDFNPASPGIVWDDTPNNVVLISALSDSSPGFYIVKTDQGNATIYLASTSENALGMCEFTVEGAPNFGSSFSFVEYEASLSRFRARKWQLELDGDQAITNVNINQIEKV